MREPAEHTHSQIEPLEHETLLAAVQRREQFLSGILGGLESFVTVDDAWRVTFANAAALRTSGLGEDELLGRDLRELARTALPRLDLAALEHALRERKTTEFEVSRPGSEQVFRCTACPLADGGVAFYARDVTEQERDQAAKRSRDELYRELVQGVNSVVLRWDGTGRITFFNDYAERLFGWRSEEVVGGPVNILIPESGDGEVDLSHLADDILADPERYRTNVNENMTRDGRRLWMAWTNKVLRDEEGAVTEVLAIGNDITELIETQQALRKSEERFRGVFESETVAMALADVEGMLVAVNQAFAGLLGYSRAELLGKDFAALTYPADLDRERTLVEEMEASERSRYRIEKRYVRKDGSLVWVDLETGVLSDANGRPEHGIAVVHDITERKAAEEQLRESTERLQLAAEAAGIGAFDWDVEAGVNLWTPELHAMYGLAPGEFAQTQTAWEQLVHEDDRGAAVALVERTLETGLPVTGQWRVVWRDGSVHWISGRFRGLKDEGGKPVRLVGVNIDITELVEAQAALRESEERLQIATEATGLGVHDYDVRAGRIEWDARLRAMWGLTPDEPVTYETFIGGIHPDDRGRIQAAMDAALDPAGERRFRETYRVIARDGTSRWVTATGHVLFEGDEAVRLVGTAEDVTSRIETQEALRESEERYRAIVELADEDLTVSADGTYSFQERIDGDAHRSEEFRTRLAVVAAGARRHKAWVLLAAIAFEFAFLVPMGLSPSSRHVLGMPGSLMALTVVVAAVLAGRQVGVAAAIAGGIIFWGTVGDFGGESAPLTIVVSTGIWIAAALLAGFLTEALTEQLQLRKSAAVALARAETLREQAGVRAAHEERVRIARDLHDSVTQALFAATLKAEALSIAGAQTPAAAGALEDVRRLSRGALAQMRTMLLELRGDPVAEVPLQQLLRHLVEAAESRASVDVVLSLDEHAALPPKAHEAAYRIAQEALNNVVRHAKAENAWVQLRAADGHARLIVGDDGRGFDAALVGQGHYGLAIMRERARETGAGLSIASAPGEGTVVAADWETA